VLKARRADLEEGAKLLLTKETLTALEFPAIGPKKDSEEENLRKTA
jgi:hypothetical protein